MDSLPLYIPNSVMGLFKAEGPQKAPLRPTMTSFFFFVGYLSLHVLKEDHKIKRHEYINLHSSECQLVLGKAFKQKVFVPLQDAGILEVYDSYIAGVRSKGTTSQSLLEMNWWRTIRNQTTKRRRPTESVQSLD